EDGIRDKLVTGVQTCALPICRRTDRAGFVPERDSTGMRSGDRREKGGSTARHPASPVPPSGRQSARRPEARTQSAAPDMSSPKRSEERRVGKEYSWRWGVGWG